LPQNLCLTFLTISIPDVKYGLLLPVLNIIANNETAAVFSIGDGVLRNTDKTMTARDARILNNVCEFSSKQHELVVPDIREVDAPTAAAFP